MIKQTIALRTPTMIDRTIAAATRGRLLSKVISSPINSEFSPPWKLVKAWFGAVRYSGISSAVSNEKQTPLRRTEANNKIIIEFVFPILLIFFVGKGRVLFDI